MSNVPEKSYFVGKLVQAVSARYESNMTSPPPRYTEDALLEDMLSAHKYATSEEDRAILKETQGLGTSRTRSPTIEGLIKGGFLVSKKVKKLFELRSTEMARIIISELPEVLTSVATTAKWEVAFGMIEKGKAQPAQVRAFLKMTLDDIVQRAKSTGTIKTGEPTERKPQQGAAGGVSSARFQGVGGAKPLAAPSGPPPGVKTSTGGSKWFG